MLFEEFVNLTGKRCSYADFEAWERLYMSSGMDKEEFCRTIKRAVVDVPAAPLQVCVIYGRMPNGNTSYEVCDLVSASISTGRVSVRHLSPRRCDIAWTTPDGMPCVVADRGRLDWIEE